MNLEGVRRQKGLTQAELSRVLGVSQQSISKYENGERKLPVDIAKKLGKYFNVEWTSFYEDER